MLDHTSTSEKYKNLMLWTLLCLMPIFGMAVDLISPSLPAMATTLNCSAEAIKNAIAIYLSGYALGNFLVGLITDSLGRRKLILVSLFCFSFVSLLPIVLPSFHMVLLTRLLQGLTLGAIAVLTRSIISDILPAEKLTQMGTVLGTMWGLGPVIGPLIGGYLQVTIGWKANFAFFSTISLVGLIAVYFIVPETLLSPQPLRFRVIKQNLKAVFSHRLFMTLTVLMGVAYSLIVSFNILGPFLIQETLGHSPLFFGRLALCFGVVFLASTFIGRSALKQYSVTTIFLAVINTIFVITLIAVVTSYFLETNLFLTVLVSALMYFLGGIIFPLSMGRGMSVFRHIAGTASAVMYLTNILITSLFGFAISFVPAHTTLALFSIYGVLLVTCVLIYWMAIYPSCKEK